jgi:hypothetical protein
VVSLAYLRCLPHIGSKGLYPKHSQQKIDMPKQV